MPLIFGVYSKKEKTFQNNFEKAIKSFAFENHQNRTINKYCFNFFQLYHCPLWSKKEIYSSIENYHIWIAGDIYNSDSTSKSSENTNGIAFQILNDFIKNNENFTAKYYGQFSIIIYNSYSNKLIITNDTFGFYPLFIYETNDYFSFCSEFEPLVNLPWFNKKLNYQAIIEYFNIGITLQNKTFYEEINLLDKSTIIEINQNINKKTQTKQSHISINKKIDLVSAVEEVSFLLKNSINTLLKNNTEQQITISGGLDTRLILNAIDENQVKNYDFVTFKTTRLDENSDRDILIAKEICKYKSLKHSVIEMPAWSVQWNKNFSTSFFNTWREKNDKRILTGVFGTEFLNSGWSCQYPFNVNTQKKTKIFNKLKFNNFSKAFTDVIINSTTNPLIEMSNIIKNIEHENSQYYFAINHFSKSFFTGIYHGSAGRWVNPFDFLTSISSPFVDEKLISFCLSLPFNIISDKNHNLYRELFKNHFSKLNHIPTTSTVVNKFNNLIPFCKTGQDPVDLKSINYKAFLNEIISNKKYLERNLYSGDIANQLNDEMFRQRFIDFEAWLMFYYDN